MASSSTTGTWLGKPLTRRGSRTAPVWRSWQGLGTTRRWVSRTPDIITSRRTQTACLISLWTTSSSWSHAWTTWPISRMPWVETHSPWVKWAFIKHGPLEVSLRRQSYLSSRMCNTWQRGSNSREGRWSSTNPRIETFHIWTKSARLRSQSIAWQLCRDLLREWMRDRSSRHPASGGPRKSRNLVWPR